MLTFLITTLLLDGGSSCLTLAEGVVCPRISARFDLLGYPSRSLTAGEYDVVLDLFNQSSALASSPEEAVRIRAAVDRVLRDNEPPGEDYGFGAAFPAEADLVDQETTTRYGAQERTRPPNKSPGTATSASSSGTFLDWVTDHPVLTVVLVLVCFVAVSKTFG